jgi:cation diffusion facilitator CzcD-associated flavoprotein CzcO
MKILGYILLTVALVGGGVSGFLWRYHLKQARTASSFVDRRNCHLAGTEER